MSTEHQIDMGHRVEWHRRRAAKLRSEALFALVAEARQALARWRARGVDASKAPEAPAGGTWRLS